VSRSGTLASGAAARARLSQIRWGADTLFDTFTGAPPGTLWHFLALVRQRFELTWHSLAMGGTHWRARPADSQSQGSGFDSLREHHCL
jgi:uncharacterized protein (DUF849 family)